MIVVSLKTHRAKRLIHVDRLGSREDPFMAKDADCDRERIAERHRHLRDWIFLSSFIARSLEKI